MLSQKWDCQWRIQKARFPTCERLKKKENCENPLFTVSRLWNHSFKTVMVQRQCVSGFKFKFSVIMHRHLAWHFYIPLCLLSRQAWQRPQMPIKRGRQKEFKQVLGKCLVFGSRMNSCVKNTLVYQSTLPLHRLKLPIPRLKRQATECQAEGWTRAWRGMTFGHEFNQKLEGVKLPNNLPNSTLWEGLSNPLWIYKYNLPTYPSHTQHIIK